MESIEFIVMKLLFFYINFLVNDFDGIFILTGNKMLDIH